MPDLCCITLFFRNFVVSKNHVMTTLKEKYKVAYHTLGCKLNFAETSTIGKILAERGFVRATGCEVPDICVVNTCSVTEVADKKGRQLIRRLVNRYPQATIIVTGCYAQLKPEEIASINGVDMVLGSNEKLKIDKYLDEWLTKQQQKVVVTPTKNIREFHLSCERGDRTRYFLKVQDGCDYFCTYCTIPLARGRSRSGTIEEMIAQARQVASEGGKEIVITGVNIGDFGKGREDNFFDLIKALDEVDGIERYRISSIEPNLLSEEIIKWVAHESRAFMPHFHIPLQSGSDEVLRLMHRHYDTALFRSRIEMIHREIPHAFIGVDVIAGARGETDDEWQRSRDFIAGLDITQLHVFPYSERPNTRALSIGHIVSQAEKHRRVDELVEISNRKYAAFVAAAVGNERTVLWEQPQKDAPMHGFTDNYLRVETDYNPELVGKISKVKLTSVVGETLMGKIED